MIDAINAFAAAAALALAVLLAGGLELGLDEATEHATESMEPVTDATGVAVPVRRYERIASATTIGDQVLDGILEPERLIAVTGESQRNALEPWRHEGRAVIEDLEDLETLIALDPDLVVVANVAEARRVARLREAGLEVFDIGGDSGAEALGTITRTLGRLVGAPERAEAMATRFEQRMAAVAEPGASRPGALYVGSWGNQLFGGATGTSYHDVLVAAGLRDVAAEAGLTGWPTYDAERLLVMDPEWLVIPASNRGAFCGRERFANLRACREDRVAAIDDAILGDPGYGMLPAAEALHRRVFGDE
ncbi:MAG: ABC transporter substrate-binding protein [Deltaproteobacteria bacterium]|nr:ABC transporter substrate-binding protein [Deltaproteobacteria bacterium]